MGAAFAGISVDEGEVGFAVIVGVGEGKLQGFVNKMDGRINAVTADFTIKEVEQAIFRDTNHHRARDLVRH